MSFLIKQSGPEPDTKLPPAGSHGIVPGNLLFLDFPAEAARELGAVLAPEGYRYSFSESPILDKETDLGKYDLIIIKSNQPAAECLGQVQQYHPEIAASYLMFGLDTPPAPNLIRECYRCGHGAIVFPIPEREFLDIIAWSLDSARSLLDPDPDEEWIPPRRNWKRWTFLAAIVLALILALAIQFFSSLYRK
jgi:hypothetical protein